MKNLTPQQLALCKILSAGHHEVADLLGPNHPTAKWFFRETCLEIGDERKSFVTRKACDLLMLFGPRQEYEKLFKV